MNVAQETLGFRRQSFSLCLSLLMSAFALPIPPATLTSHLHRPTERSPTVSAVSYPLSAFSNPLRYLANQPLQHARHRFVFTKPVRKSPLIDVAKIRAITRPDLHLVARAERHY